MVNDPIDPKYLTEVPFGRRSFWIQPWRSYLDTWPASRLLNAVGINFNVSPSEADGTARLLQSSGFKLARSSSAGTCSPTTTRAGSPKRRTCGERLVALREHGLRPLILLNANSGGPGPAEAGHADNHSTAAAAGAASVS